MKRCAAAMESRNSRSASPHRAEKRGSVDQNRHAVRAGDPPDIATAL